MRRVRKRGNRGDHCLEDGDNFGLAYASDFVSSKMSKGTRKG